MSNKTKKYRKKQEKRNLQTKTFQKEMKETFEKFFKAKNNENENSQF